MMQTDLLESVQGSLVEALAEGKTFRTWAKGIRPELEKAGWWGVGEVDDPLAGERKLAQLGSPHRLKKIYQVNMRQARAAGQWQRIQRTKKALPFLIYELGPSSEHREQHVAWHGTILPVDDPWWDTHTPMNGWGCKCRVRQISGRERERLVRDGVPDQGVAELDSEGLPTGRRIRGRVPAKTERPPLNLQKWRNQRLGATFKIPRGIDPGFETNPGAIYRLDRFSHAFTQKLTKLQPEIGSAAFEAVRGRVLPVISREFRALAAPVLKMVERHEFKPAGDMMVVGAVKPKVASWLTNNFGVSLRSSALAIRTNEIVHLYRDTKKSRGAAAAKSDVLRLPEILNQPVNIYWDTGYRGKKKSAQEPALLYVFPAQGRLGKIVVRLNFREKGIREDGTREKLTVNWVRTAGTAQDFNFNESHEGIRRYRQFPGTE